MADTPAARLGANVEELRKKHRLTQAALAGLARVPRSTIAHLESGAGNPTLGNLARIAGALRVSIEELLSEPRGDCRLIKARDIPRTQRGYGSVTIRRLLPDPLPGLQMERLDIRPGGFMRGVPHVQGTKEYLTCIAGTIRLSTAGRDFDLFPGDVLAFPGDQPHTYHNPGRSKTDAISVVALAPAGS